MSGYVHVYTGNGKGKTTAALGLVLRAAGAGWRVFFAQFGKATPSSELEALARFHDRITIRRYGQGGWTPRPDSEGLAECGRAIASGEYPLVVLDEANLGPALRIFTLDELLAVIDSRPPDVELVLTGRDAHPAVIARADLVTEMREVKHYFRRGVLARTGIEQ